MSLPDQTGKQVPQAKFKIREGYEWVEKTTDDFFKGKKVVLFALPGAFTPTCSSTHLPRYNELYEAFKEAGIDDVICLSVNDSFVMNDWKRDQNAKNITMLPDGNGEFSERLGFLVDKSDLGFGKRSWRYSMLVNDGKIEKMFIEEEKPGDPFNKSDADTMLKYLDGKIPKSVAMFTRPGCPFCAKAAELLQKNNCEYEEHVLNRDFSIKTLVAISGATTVPQIFIQGERIGGADELEKYFQS
ncbi:MAG: glutathione peroxidase [Halobacteriovoraceae bacterium]|nr:glutathione peroxidase [Halobacteriovoraceae bacterium]|tara:strand:- start:70827 stop:71555 length:729 start_codon:yes stop_codon:yes gene_type:complete